MKQTMNDRKTDFLPLNAFPGIASWLFSAFTAHASASRLIRECNQQTHSDTRCGAPTIPREVYLFLLIHFAKRIELIPDEEVNPLTSHTALLCLVWRPNIRMTGASGVWS
jgi:hypothetical protein